MREKIRNIITNRYFLHLAFWMTWILSTVVLYHSQNRPVTLYFLQHVFFVHAQLALVVYVHLFLLLPIFYQQKYLRYTVLVLMLISASAGLSYFIDYYSPKTTFTSHVISYTLFLFISSGIHHYRRMMQQNQEMVEKQAAAEIKLLRSQIDPHFFFNTLNSLHALSLTQSQKTSEAIVQFANLMRYVFESNKDDYVLLHDEVDYLNNYVSLEKLRFMNRVDICFTVEGNISGKYIAPLLLLTFVENAFKHGGEDLHGKGSIAIHLAIQLNELFFTVENSKSMKEAQPVSGIGLITVKRRLALLYSNKHQLDIKDTPDRFHVSLHIIL